MKNKFDADQEFDRAAREALENFEMPFDEKDWQSFQVAYEEDKKKAKLYPIRSLLSLKGGALALIFGFSACLLAYGVYNNNYSDLKVSNNTSKKTTKIQATNKAEETQLSSPNNSQEHNDAMLSPTREENTLAKKDLTPLASINEKTMPNSLSKKNKKEKENALKTATPKTVQFEEKSTTSLALEKSNKNGNISNKNTAISGENKNSTNSDKAIYTLANTSNTNAKDAKNISQNNLDNAASTPALNTGNSDLSNNNILAENTLKEANSNNNAFLNADNTNKLSAIAQGNSTETIILENWDLSKTSLEKKKKTNPDFELKKAEPLTPFVRQFRFGAVTGVENQAKNSYGKSNATFTIGILGELSLSKLISIQAGLNLSLRTYENSTILLSEDLPQIPTSSEITEHIKTHQRLAVIPIAIQWNIYSNKLWRIYAQTGVNTYFNLSQHYSGIRETTLEQSNGSIRFSSNIAKNEYEGSILQENTFKDNVFFTTQFGLGIERKLSNKWSLFVQPHMQYSINAINRFGDKAYTLALHVGAKTTF